jgi:predicted ester cyclase
MSVEENKAIARRYIEEGCSNPDMLGEVVAENVVLHPTNISDLESLKQGISANQAGLPDWRFVVEDLIAEGDKVVACWKATGTQTVEWFGLSPTNKQATWEGATILRIAGGKIVEMWNHGGQLEMWQSLGLVPPWEELVERVNSRQA